MRAITPTMRATQSSQLKAALNPPTIASTMAITMMMTSAIFMVFSAS